MPKTVNVPRPAEGEVLFDTEEKIFEDLRANPGEQAFVFIHSVPYEGSVALVNLLTSTRLVRKGFKVSIVLYGPGVLLASGTRGYLVAGTRPDERRAARHPRRAQGGPVMARALQEHYGQRDDFVA